MTTSNSSTPEPKPETSPEPEGGLHGTLFPELMGNQQAFIINGGLIFLLFIFCIILLVLFLKLKKRFKKLSSEVSESQYHLRASTGKIEPKV
ncbi:hypothetical protein AC249_AIPGENE24795 [Exaiptasia diaphana]|nr:hypothetical protein AC249_AIPGENE24795 [Exaiptasia diaphana]